MTALELCLSIAIMEHPTFIGRLIMRIYCKAQLQQALNRSCIALLFSSFKTGLVRMV